MRECLGKHSCMSSLIPVAILNGSSVFPDSETPRAQKRIRCEMAILADALVTLYKALDTTLMHGLHVFYIATLNKTCSIRSAKTAKSS